MRLSAILVGAAAGGGFPQWNCRCRVCRLAWEGDPRATPRSQASLAVTVDRRRWVLVDASPDLRAQILATPPLRPQEGLRHTPIAAVVVTSGDIDRIAGLLDLRERQPFDLWAEAGVLAEIEASPVFRVLDPALVRRRTLPAETGVEILPGLWMEAFPVPGKIPLYREAEGQSAADREGHVTALRFTDGDDAIVYAPGCAHVDGHLTDRLDARTTLLLDGTVFTDDEMIAAGVGHKTGRRMGHAPIIGEGGSLEALRRVSLARRIYVHVNNTNPILIAGSPEQRLVAEAGWEVGVDGMDIRA